MKGTSLFFPKTMVQGLAFLSKKSWHTKNFSNQEKVWQAEEKKRHEEQKTKELAKQIQQEREEEELDAIAGVTRKRDRTIDWMYQGSAAQTELKQSDKKQQAEDYLLGKSFAPAAGTVKGDLDAEDTKEGVHAVVAASSTAVDGRELKVVNESAGTDQYYGPSVQERNEAFTLRFEDPMFAVTQRTQEREQHHEDTKALYEKVTGKVALDSLHDQEKDRKRRRKRAKEERRTTSKRQRKDHKAIKHEDDYSSESTNRDRRMKKSKSKSKFDRDERRRVRSDSCGSGTLRSTDSDVERQRRRRERGDRKDSCHERGGQHHSYDERSRRHRPSHSDHVRGRGYKHDYSGDDSANSENFVSRGERRQRESNKEQNHGQQSHQQGNRCLSLDDKRKEGYGLQGGTSASYCSRDLGPNSEIIERKRRDRENERRRLVRSHRRRGKERTPAERQAALQEMERDAQQRDSTRSRGPVIEGDDEAPQGNASFLRGTRRSVYGVN